MKLEEYLLQDHTSQTVKIYLRDIRVYLDYVTEEKAAVATYQDIMQYVDYLRKQYQNPRTINRMLYGVKAWYQWLCGRPGKGHDHPLPVHNVERCQNSRTSSYRTYLLHQN
jgi:site-specific recombinase XerD